MKSNIFNLVKVMLKSDDNYGLSNAKDSHAKRVTKIVLFVVVMIFAGFSMSLNITSVFESLKAIGQERQLIMMIYRMSSMVVLIFSFIYIMSTFYFSKDVDRLLYLPITSREILAAKYLTNYIYQLGTVVIIGFPMFIAYGIADNAGLGFYIKTFLSLLIIPIIPTAFAGTVIFILMRFSRLFRNKDVFNMLSGVIAIAFAFGINFFIVRQPGDTATSALMKSDSVLLNIISPMNYFISDRLFTTFVDYLIGFTMAVGLSLLLLIIFFIVGRALYIDGVQGISETSAKREVLSSNKIKTLSKSNGEVKALVLKDLKVLLRTPAYFINLVIPSLITLLFMVGYGTFLFFKLSNGEINLSQVMSFIRAIDLPMITIITACSILLFLTMAPISSTSFTREGQNFYVIKYLPVNLKKVLDSKLIVSALISLPVLIFILVPSFILLANSRIYIILGGIIGLAGAMIINSLSLLLDSVKPSLEWENETKAVKQGFNPFAQFLLSIVVVAIVIGLSYVLDFTSFTYSAVVVPLFLVLAIISYLMMQKFGQKALLNKE